MANLTELADFVKEVYRDLYRYTRELAKLERWQRLGQSFPGMADRMSRLRVRIANTRTILAEAREMYAIRGGFSLISGSMLFWFFFLLAVAGISIYMYQNWNKPTSGTLATPGPRGNPATAPMGGNAVLTWTWSVTSVDFAGNINGGPNQWSFHGILMGGGNAIWNPKRGSGTTDCTVGIANTPNGTINCTANFTDPQPRHWVGEANGQIETESVDGKLRVGFRGINGTGDGGEGKAGIDLLRIEPRD